MSLTFNETGTTNDVDMLTRNKCDSELSLVDDSDSIADSFSGILSFTGTETDEEYVYSSLNSSTANDRSMPLTFESEKGKILNLNNFDFGNN